MYVVVDQRPAVTAAYRAMFAREGLASVGFDSEDFQGWLESASGGDVSAVESFIIGEVDRRPTFPPMIRSRSRAPIIALSEIRSLVETLELLTAGIDDVVRKPVHVREIIARSHAIWRRAFEAVEKPQADRLQVYFDGRDPEIDGVPHPLPRRERHILEYLVKNRHRRITKTQIFNAIYGIFDADVDEIVVEGHVSKLRKKLRLALGHDVIDAKRYLGYQFIG